MKLNTLALASALAAAAVPACDKPDLSQTHTSKCTRMQVEYARLAEELTNPKTETTCSKNLPKYLDISDTKKKLDEQCMDLIDKPAYDKVMKQVQSRMEQIGCLAPSDSAKAPAITVPAASPAKTPVTAPSPTFRSDSEGR